ncbi:hypothetical protein [Fodinibacter luteus]|uniref:hypothetical protein n=1 Tax=Fodinibacter luteus TaxID=552064 RepID=UPI0031EA83BD
MTPQDEQDLVRLLAHQVVQVTAPEELLVFDETAEEYFADPHGVLAATGRDEAVGFGVDMALLTPYILAVATPVIQLLASMVGDALKKEGQPSVHAFVRRLLRRDEGTQPAPAAARPEPLTPDQLARVRQVATERGRAVGLPQDQADLLADAIAGGISVTPTT